MKRIDKVKRICKNCGKEFYAYPSAVKKDGCFYCSRECFWIDFRKRIKKIGSGAKGKHWKHTKEYCEKLSKARKGEKNPMWKGGVSKIRSRYQRPSWKTTIWRNKVLERDDYTCRECGKRNCNLYAHHIQPWSINKKLRYAIYNGVSLCLKCHQYVHMNERMLEKQNERFNKRD